MLTRSPQNRSKSYQTVIAMTHDYARHGRLLPYRLLVRSIAATIDEERAKAYRLSRLRKNPSETDADTITLGQQALARKYIDSAHRAGRITYWDGASTARYVFPGDPPTTGGLYAKRIPAEYIAYPTAIPPLID